MLLLNQSFHIMGILSLNANIALVQYFKRKGQRKFFIELVMYPAILAPNLELPNTFHHSASSFNISISMHHPQAPNNKSYLHLRSKLSPSSHLRYFCEALPRWHQKPSFNSATYLSNCMERNLELDSPRPTTGNRQMLLESLLTLYINPETRPLALNHYEFVPEWLRTYEWTQVCEGINRYRGTIYK